MPRSISVLPGSTWTSNASAARARPAAGRWPCERAWHDQARRAHDEQASAGPPRGPACAPRSVRVGTVSSQSCDRRWSRASRMTAVCRNPSRPEGAATSSLDGGQQPGAQLGMLRLDPAGDPARVARRSERPGSRRRSPRPTRQRSRTSRAGARRGIGSMPGRAEHEAQAQADQGQREPAERQAAPEPDLSESARDLFQGLPQFACS